MEEPVWCLRRRREDDEMERMKTDLRVIRIIKDKDSFVTLPI